MPSTYDTGFETLDASDLPITSVHVPGTGVAALQGGTASTDSLGVSSAPIATSVASNGSQDNITVLASAARTTTQTQADQTNTKWRGCMVILDMTAVGTGSVTLEIDGKDPVSGKYFALLTGAAVITNSTNVYTVYPGAPVTANVSASTVLPPTFRVKVTANNANSATYSVGFIGLA